MKITRLLFNKITFLIALVAIAAGGYYWWQQRPTEVKYRTTETRTGDIIQSVSANGTLKPVVLVNVGTQVSGSVKKLHVDFNDKVRQGQVLLELDPAVLEAQVRQTEANLASARASVDLTTANELRAQNLFKQDYISRQDLDTSIQAARVARAQVEQISAQLVRDKTNLGYTIIRSPVSGVVVSRSVDVGQTVAASFSTPTLFQIAQDLSRMQIDTAFAEADIGSIKPGQAVQFTVDAFPNRNFKASVRQVRLNATTTQNVVTYNVVVAVDNPEEILLPSMTAYVGVITAQRSNVLTVPNAALRFRPPGAGGAAPSPAKRESPAAKAPPPDGEAPPPAAEGEAPQRNQRQAAQPGDGDGTATTADAGGSSGKSGRRRPGAAKADADGAAAKGTSASPGSRPGRRAAAGAGAGGEVSASAVVYVLGANNQLRRVPIRIGISDGRSTEVSSGELKAGDQVVTGIEDTSGGPSGPVQGQFRLRLF